MKTRKLLAAALTFMTAAPLCSAQSIFSHDDRVYYGARLGVTLSTINSDEDHLDGQHSMTGLNLGVVAGILISQDYPVILESGLSYTEKGGEGRYMNHKITYSINYLELPVLAKYKCDLGDDLSLQPFAGGYLAIGVSGKIKNYDLRKSYSSYGSDSFKRFDGGLRFGCALEYQMLYIEAAYDLGLSNISHSDFDTSRNRCFFINAGVNF